MSQFDTRETLHRVQISDAITDKKYTHDIVEPIWTETQDTHALSALPYTRWVSSRSDWVPRKTLKSTDRRVAEVCREARDIIHSECEGMRQYYKAAQNETISSLLSTGLTAVQQPRTPVSRSVEFGTLRGELRGREVQPQVVAVETPFGVTSLVGSSVQSQERRELEQARIECDTRMRRTLQEAQRRREDVARRIQEDIDNRSLCDVGRASSAAAAPRGSSFISRKEQCRGQSGSSDSSSGDRVLSSSMLEATNNYRIYKGVYNNLIAEPFVIPSTHSRVLAGRVTANYMRHVRRVAGQIGSQSERREDL